MSRWSTVIRGMIGTGLTFAAGVGVIASVVAGVVWVLSGGEADLELFRVAVACAVWAFPIGMVFSGLVALTAHGRSFEELSLPRFAALGAAGGLALFGLLALNAWDAWTLPTAIVNAAIFVVLGSGSATASLALARRVGPALEAGDEPDRLGGGEARLASEVQGREGGASWSGG